MIWHPITMPTPQPRSPVNIDLSTLGSRGRPTNVQARLRLPAAVRVRRRRTGGDTGELRTSCTHNRRVGACGQTRETSVWSPPVRRAARVHFVSTDGTPPKEGLTIPWQWVTVILGMVAVSRLGALVVVAHKPSADGLSTVALALAILAFAAQPDVSLAQGMASTQLVGQVERVNTDTQSALSAIRATSETLVATRQKQFRDVLQAAIARASSDTLDPTYDLGSDQSAIEPTVPEFAQAVLRELTEMLSAQDSHFPFTSQGWSSQPIDTGS